eukprot:2948588-Rhodomonas_salina.2
MASNAVVPVPYLRGFTAKSSAFSVQTGLGDVHLALLNPHERTWFRSRFGNRLFFFLSRFLWRYGCRQIDWSFRGICTRNAVVLAWFPQCV